MILKQLQVKQNDLKKYNDTGVYLGGYIDLYGDDETNIKVFKNIGEFINY